MSRKEFYMVVWAKYDGFVGMARDSMKWAMVNLATGELLWHHNTMQGLLEQINACPGMERLDRDSELTLMVNTQVK